MYNLKQLDHLVDLVEAAAWEKAGVPVPLSWAEAPPENRDNMLSGPHEGWQSVTEQSVWGRPQSYFWFAGEVVLPDTPDLWLRIDAQFGRTMGRSDPQCLVRLNGQIAQGADANHRLIPLDQHKGGETLRVMVEAGTIEDRTQVGFACTVLSRDSEMEQLYFDLSTALDVARHLPEVDHRRDVLLAHIKNALDTVDLRPGNSVRRAESIVAARGVMTALHDIADTQARPTVTVTGHTHIDVAWLWRVRETRQKMARSVATALSLMRSYLDYVFMYNQGYLLDTLEQDYPELFSALKDRQKTGQVEIEGALWLEPDANMTGGESLVRHITRGVRYHQKTFGVRPRLLWLPDTFGYSPALPQLMAQSGLDVFITHKMSWNDTNKMPYEVFWWEGIDGTRVPTYFLTTQPMESTSIGTTYCPDLKPSHVMGTWRRYSQKDGEDHLWLCYGHGDGGGGPTREMLERIRRMEAGLPGCPKVEHGPMGPYFAELARRMRAAPGDYPAWVGELYLEFHRGTYTSVAEVKRNNRRAEAALREIEALAVLAVLEAGVDYPRSAIEALWDVVLLNQFHDILPGSSIAEVYDDSREEFAKFFANAAALSEQLAGALGGDLVPACFGQARGGFLSVPGDQPVSLEGVASQGVIGADGAVAQLVPLGARPGTGARRIDLRPASAATGTGGLSVGLDHLENDRLRVVFDVEGRMTSLTDKTTGREILSGPANHLVAYRDQPAQFDAWDIDETYKGQAWKIDDLRSSEIVETGPYRAAIRFRWAYEASTITQVISLEAGAPLVEVDCHIDWAEKNTLLKADFPLTIQSDSVLAETQFGYVRRPSHRNTSWDTARFEACMHRWVGMEEPGQVACLLNDCKYGYDAEGSTLRLTLLRAPTWPWDGADIGPHRMRYGIAVATGIDVVPAVAEGFNHPARAILAGRPGRGSIVGVAEVAGEDVGLDAVKLSEDGAAVILRLCQRTGARSTTQIALHPRVKRVFRADLMEVPSEALALEQGKVTLSLPPFGIATLRLELEEG